MRLLGGRPGDPENATSDVLDVLDGLEVDFGWEEWWIFLGMT